MHVLLCLAFFPRCNDFEFIQVVVYVVGLFRLLMSNSPVYGHTTFWLCIHLVLDIWIIPYPHLKDEQTKAKKNNLAEGHTISDNSWKAPLLTTDATAQHQDLNTDLAPGVLALSPWAVTDGMALSYVGIPFHRWVVLMSALTFII